VLCHYWEAEEARRFITVAKKLGPQPAAFCTLVLNTGARKRELCAAKWPEFNSDSGSAR